MKEISPLEMIGRSLAKIAAGAGVAASRKAIRLIADDGSGQES